MCRDKKKPTSASAMIGARCGQLDGLYDHPGGASGPGSMRIPAGIGMPGARMAKTITSVPTSVSLVYSAARAQKRSGATSSQTPTSEFAQGAQNFNSGREDTERSASSKT